MSSQPKAATKPPKRRTRQALNLSGCSEYRELADGTWEAYFPVLDVRATAATEDEVRLALQEAVGERINTGGDDVQRIFQEWAQDNIIEQEITEEQYQAELAERRKQKRYPSSGLPQLTPKTFNTAVASSTPTLVDYWASWCEPCHMMAPVLHELKDKLASQLNVCAVDVEKYGELWERFDLKGVPTLIVFKDGEEVQRILGTRSVEELVAELQGVLGGRRRGVRCPQPQRR